VPLNTLKNLERFVERRSSPFHWNGSLERLLSAGAGLSGVNYLFRRIDSPFLLLS
jgi:hypothetical protein